MYTDIQVLTSVSMTRTADISVYSPDHRLVLVVEVKAGKETSPRRAGQLRRNLLTHGLVADAPFFLLAFPTSLFLWTPDTSDRELPAYSAAAKPVLREYLGGLVDRSRGVGEESLQIALQSWLGDLASTARRPELDSEPDQMLVDSGLYEQIKRGDVKAEVAQ